MNGRDTDGRFTNGNNGRPAGARNRTTMAVLDLLNGQAQAIRQKAIQMALQGDTTALRLCLDRIAPPRKDNHVEFPLPRMTTVRDAAEAAGAVLQAVSSGELTPIEAVQIMGLIDSLRRVLETTELEARVAALEGQRV